MGKPGTKISRLEHSAELAGNPQLREAVLASYAIGLATNAEPEQAYRTATPLDHRKSLGQFFTPVPIAEVMAEWIGAIRPKTILDPAVGPGVFPRILARHCPQAHVTCMEIDPVALQAARIALSNNKNVTLLEGDFLLWGDDHLFDAAIANPPYLRHHDLNYPFDIFNLVGNKNNIRLSRLSNIYVLFILEVCRRLRVGGRAAIIVPGEWVNANFGDQLKLWLASRGLLHTLLYFSHISSQFEDALTTASILLLEQPRPHTGREIIRTIFVNDGAPLEEIRQILQGKPPESSGIVVQEFTPEFLLQEKKWNHLLAYGSEGKLPGFVKLGELAKTRRGIATGSNSFFHITHSAATRLALRRENLVPCIGRAQDVRSVVFGEKDFARLVEEDRRAYLFDMRSQPNEAERAYLREGEAKGLDKRYLCAARSGKWYRMEQRPPAAIWATVFGRKGLRFIHNAERVANLTTFHCIYPVVDAPMFTAALTACLNSRVVQGLARRQHRVYGGGLLKVEPKDLLEMEVPDLRRVAPTTLRVLAGLLGCLDTAVRSVELTEYGVKSALDDLDCGVVNASKDAATACAQEKFSQERAGTGQAVQRVDSANHVGGESSRQVW